MMGDKEAEPSTLPCTAGPGDLSHHCLCEHPSSVPESKGNGGSCSTLKSNSETLETPQNGIITICQA